MTAWKNSEIYLPFLISYPVIFLDMFEYLSNLPSLVAKIFIIASQN